MKILFMGTPDFAVKPLEALCENFEVVGVITQPDKPKGRHMVLTPPPVKVTALEKGIGVYQPETLKDNAISELLEKLSPDIIVVVAYGKILPEYVLSYPKYGCINLHGSLLPKYRGAAPMQRAIMEGEKVVGVTTMYMAKGLDTGDMLEKAAITLNDKDNFESVHDKLSEIGAELLISTVKKLEKNEIIPQKQDDSLSTYAAKIENNDCVIDFSKSADNVFNQIRGLSPFPLAFCMQSGKRLKIVEAALSTIVDTSDKPVGTVLSLDNGKITIKCQKGSIAIKKLLPEGKSKMTASDYINGRKISVGDILL